MKNELTPENKWRAIALYLDGKSILEIASIIGIFPGVVRVWIKMYSRDSCYERRHTQTGYLERTAEIPQISPFLDATMRFPETCRSDMSDLSIGGKLIWDLSNGSERLRLSRGVGFLELLYGVRIDPRCVDTAYSIEDQSFPKNKVRFTLSVLNETCARFSEANNILRRIIQYEEMIPEIESEIDELAEARLDNYEAHIKQIILEKDLLSFVKMEI